MTWSRTAYANSATARREAFVKLAMIHQMTRRLVKKWASWTRSS
jgi:hypothetical protein